jgi:crotonobetainyl-CoA:carnitine CoA-transferase CaiB-like acyl-CoA transferase
VTDRPSGPLSGLLVADFSRVLAGPYATMLLADLGAEVVKVEEPGRGDYLRTIPPFVEGEGLMHRVLNRGKKSLALDYRTEEGRATLDRLALAADVLVEVSRPGRLAEFGIDLADLRRRHPALVVCSVSAYGQTGPLASLPAHGMNMDAFAGWVSTDPWNGRRRIASGIFTSVAVELGGLNAAVGILAALLEARATGQGTWIEVSCWDAAVEATRLRLAHHAAFGCDLFDVRELGPLYDVYEAGDGRLVLFGALERKFWARFCAGVERPDLADRWSGGGAVQFEDDAELRAVLDGIFAERPAAEWIECFIAWEVPGAEILPPGEVLEHPHFQARHLIDELDRDDPVPSILDPVVCVDTQVRPGTGAPPSPALGEHTEEVMKAWLGEERTGVR